MHLPIGHKHSTGVDKSLTEANKRPRSAKNGHPRPLGKGTDSFEISPLPAHPHDAFPVRRVGAAGETCAAGSAAGGHLLMRQGRSRRDAAHLRGGVLVPRSCKLWRHISAASSRSRLGWDAVGRHELLNTRGGLVSILAFHRINYRRGRFGGSSIGAAWPQAKRRCHRLRDKSGGDLAARRFGGA